MSDKPVKRCEIGSDIRWQHVRARLFMRVIGPKGTEFDYWIIGFRLFSLFVFLNRLSWGQMYFSVEWRKKMRFVRSWRWFRAHRR